ncbi:MAG: hypothetical protein HY691_05485 [Chloroflexi bacterium]|nr:hypothetical protein [Chloroflexota bacterium]
MPAILRVLLAAAVFLLVATPALAQDGVKALRQKYAGLTKEQVTAMGYGIDPFCITAAAEGLPASLGAMGFHAVHPALYKKEFKLDQPQVLLVDGSGKVVGVEWETGDTKSPAPTMFGSTFQKSGPHPGNEQDHWMLHIYFQADGSELVATWNPRLTCPAGSAPPAPPAATALPRAGGPAVPLDGLAAAGAVFVALGVALRLRRA